MRWDNLLADQDAGATVTIPLFPGETVVRRFSTPEFRGMTFYEVAARSIINHVPGDRFGFNWTINPYRGCSHACAYCLAGTTGILMADGTTRALATLREGDAVYGTAPEGEGRRYVRTRILRHWRTVKPAVRVVLADGTELLASGDHRLLTQRGWRHVAGGRGADGHPGLNPADTLVGTGRYASAPDGGAGYQKGYLYGLIRGGAHLGAAGVVNFEAIRRGRQFLLALGLGIGGQAQAPLDLVEAGAGRGLARPAPEQPAPVGLPVGLPEGPSGSRPDEACTEWARGFLAGTVDARGPGAPLRCIAAADPDLLALACRCLERLGLPFMAHAGEVRLTGGVRERLRFLHSVEPAVSRAWALDGEAVPTDRALQVVAVEPLGVQLPMYDITTGTGDFIANGVVSHNCFARPTHTYLDFDAGRDFETRIVVKVNAPDLLRRELRRATWKGPLIAMGTNTDPYQRAEGQYRLMRGILAELNAARNPYSILTKGTLIRRDIDLLQEGAAVTEVSANFSVGTVDEAVWRASEPGTPHPLKRLETVKMLNEAGIPCGVLMAPILPGISDRPEQLEATVRAAADAGATHVTPITLHLRPGVKEEFLGWLDAHYPELGPSYAATYRRAYARKDVGEGIGRQVADLRRRFGVTRTRPTGGRGRPEPGPAAGPAVDPAGVPAPGTAEPPAPAAAGGDPEATGQLSWDLGPEGPRRAPRHLRRG